MNPTDVDGAVVSANFGSDGPGTFTGVTGV